MNEALDKKMGGLALLTDLYQLTMACAYWKSGKADQESVFHLFFRKNPFQGGFTLVAGLEDAVAYLRSFRFEESDLGFLATLRGRDDRPLFEPAFLDYLRTVRFACDVDAMPEGTVAFPHQPLLRVRGPILQAQLVETALLNLINFQSLIATKAARVCLDANYLFYTVREPFPTQTTGASLVFGRVTPETPLIIESRMAENGVIFSDGIEQDFLEFNSGTQAVIGLAERHGVLVV